MRVLVTGGAGFVGSHLADALIAAGHEVRALDSMLTQVHGLSEQRPSYLHPDVELFVGDVRDRHHVREALRGIDAVFHFAALVGVGQSMYEPAEYVSANSHGTAVLLEELSDHRMRRSVKRLVVASSMSVYGEGSRMMIGDELAPCPTSELCHPTLRSVYALTKYEQERMCLLMGQAYGIPTMALRFFNIYGPRQSLNNPYTGVIAIFASRLLNGKPPLIFDDGAQSRDFVSVYDIVQACMLALDDDAWGVLNVGTGVRTSVNDVAKLLADALGVPIRPQYTGTKRVGDIRHCYADISAAQSILGYEPQVTLEAGMADLCEWLRGQTAVDSVEKAVQELATRGLSY